jgi:hypothetical protein
LLLKFFIIFRSPEARRKRAEEENNWRYDHLSSSTGSILQTTTLNTTENAPIEVPQKSYQVYNIHSSKNSSNSICATTPESEGSILVTMYNNTNARRANTEESFEMGNAWIHPSNDESMNSENSLTQFSSSRRVPNMRTTTNESFLVNRQPSIQQTRSTFSSPSATMSDIGQGHNSSSKSFNFKDWTRLYLFGHKPDTGLPRISRPS